MMQQPKWLHASGTEQKSRMTTKVVLFIFATVYIAAVVVLRNLAWRDPTSKFFNPDAAYLPQYSEVRWYQTEKFLANATSSSLDHYSASNTTLPELCIGVPTVARKGAQYLRTALGSLLEGLRVSERNRINLIVFIAELDPADHPAYRKPWLTELVDTTLLYDLPTDELQRLGNMDDQHKSAFDYRYLLNACHATGAPYVALIEDDVLASSGWLRRTMAGLDRITSKITTSEWLYLRLFYTETYFGWNDGDLFEHVAWSLLLIASVALSLLATHLFAPKSRAYISNILVISLCCICAPLCITLFFLAGRVTIFPFANGVHKMDKYGCCSQGLVFNRPEIPALLDMLSGESGLFFDMRVEQYADEHGLDRWALQPPVLQHMGIKSSSDGGLKSKNARKVWSFAFERTKDNRGPENEELRV
ncbi:hypothetical protein CLAFUW4_03809 [Fulvia fulva]|uniref:Integral membrane protein n=1 Tax=Passalora fulva TaxID=5499 RepID=A0A9Q8P504_PASFU|nr:uncharacterized protein CLAFUR5_03781 [Fulvia fulva]KAK4633588.1 hypothetical protein CLAFUR0_03796 [Fulvia fulva]UJO13381.1 hypothetical protein CLAFUR5_03781 [Fulvia fulva]WPV10967.1 hypothetical protein CLAFUW4_03809 [Fulvia fulva]